MAEGFNAFESLSHINEYILKILSAFISYPSLMTTTYISTEFSFQSDSTHFSCGIHDRMEEGYLSPFTTKGIMV